MILIALATQVRTALSPNAGLKRASCLSLIGADRGQNGAKPERGIETVQANCDNESRGCQNGAKPERGIETAIIFITCKYNS